MFALLFDLSNILADQILQDKYYYAYFTGWESKATTPYPPCLQARKENKNKQVKNMAFF